MSYFLCLAIPREAAPNLRRSFDQTIYLRDVTSYPIGKVARGADASWVAYMLEIGSSSGKLVGFGVKKRTHNNDKSELLVAGIRSLMADDACPSLGLLPHWFRGYISTEAISVRYERRIKASYFAEVVLNIEEDVRYVVSKDD